VKRFRIHVIAVRIVRKTTVGTRRGRGNESLAFGLVALPTTTLIFRMMLSCWPESSSNGLNPR